MEIGITILISLLSGVVASIIVVLLFKAIKPRVLLSKHISKYRDKNNPDEFVYYFKIVNKSFHTLINVNYFIELNHCFNLDIDDDGKQNNMFEVYHIEPHKEVLSLISKRRRNDPNCENAVYISFKIEDQKDPVTQQKLRDFLNNSLQHSFIRISFYAESTLSDGSILKKSDIDISHVVQKPFCAGNTVKLKI